MKQHIGKLIATGLIMSVLPVGAQAGESSLGARQALLGSANQIHDPSNTANAAVPNITVQQARDSLEANHSAMHYDLQQKAQTQSQDIYNASTESISQFQDEYSDQKLKEYAKEHPAVFIGHPTLATEGFKIDEPEPVVVPGTIHPKNLEKLK